MSIDLSNNALTVLKKRGYLIRKGEDEYETPEEMFRRVAMAVAAPDLRYGATVEDVRKTEEQFYEMMASLDFLAGAVLMNAGRRNKMLSACFVLPLEDSLEGIFKTMRDAALVSRMGGGLGMPFSHLRSRGATVLSTGGAASGPVSYLRLFDHMGDVINEGCSRRVAMLAALKVDHPDIEEFITSKVEDGALKNFNISVAITDNFMEVLEKDGTYPLVDPHTRQVVAEMPAKKIWEMIAHYAHQTADPGLLFIDKMNATNPVPHLGSIESTNVCGEQPLMPYESCNLGNINLSKVVKKDGSDLDWPKLKNLVHDGIHYLDNVIDVCEYPIPEIGEMSRTTRKIGLGVMGWADMLVALGISYQTQEAVDLGGKLSKFIQDEARQASVILGEKRGSFPGFVGSKWETQYPAMRNSTVNTVSPTGTTSIIANCSSSIEPIFALAYVRKNLLDLDKTTMYEVNQEFERIAKERGFYSKELMQKIGEKGGVQHLDEVPDDVKEIFVIAHDVPWEWHIRMQAAWQKHVDSAVSKTINMPSDVIPEDVANAFKMAFDTGCKGITIYRDKSKSKQVLNIAGSQEKTDNQDEGAASNGCPECGAEMQMQDGCKTCPECSYSYCLG